MTNPNPPKTQEIAPDEKLTPVMAYTHHHLIWGQVVSKEAIRVSSWLRSDLAPVFMRFLNAQILLVGGSQNKPPTKVPTLHLQTKNILAYHIMPPASDILDYDQDEPNRKMIPVTAHTGYFNFSGSVRMAEFSNLENYLSAIKGEFTTLYDISMICPLMPSIKGVKASMVLLRISNLILAA